MGEGMPVQMYGETQIVDFQVCSLTVLYMAKCGTVRGIQQWWNHIHSMKYAEVINDIRTRNALQYVCWSLCVRYIVSQLCHTLRS